MTCRTRLRWSGADMHPAVFFLTTADQTWLNGEDDLLDNTCNVRPVAAEHGEDGVGKDWARPVVHWEIIARDPGRQAAFYRELFNWEVGDGPIMQIPAGLGGPEPGPGGHIRAGEHPAVILYVQVRDLRAALAHVP